MGQEVLYCFKCQERVTSADLDASTALRFGNKTACRNCIPALMESLTPQERKDLVSRVQNPQKRAALERPRSPAFRPRRPDSRTTLGIFSAVVALAVAAIAAVVLNKADPPPPPERPVVQRPPPPPPPGPSPAEREAIAREAQRKTMVSELAAVEERARVALRKEDFGAALATFEAIRNLHPDPDWKNLVDAKVGEVRTMIDATYQPLRERAALARKKGDEAEVKSIDERVGRWGLADKAADLNALLRSTAAPAPIPVPAPVEASPWIPLFDGRSLDFLVSGGEGAWKVENGAMVSVKGSRSSAQTRRVFSDGALRARIQWRDVENMTLCIRQGFDGTYTIWLDRAQLRELEGKEHELILTFKGPDVSATLDGKPVPVAQDKNPLKGSLQLKVVGESFVIKSLEYRE